MTTRLFLVRHGESIWNAEGRVQGQADPPLSALGRWQADTLTAALRQFPVAAVYTSTLLRASETAECIAAPHALVPLAHEAWREVHLGAWEGRLRSDLMRDSGTRQLYAAWDRDPSAVRPPGAEALASARARAHLPMAALAASHPNATVVLVTHSLLGRILLCHLLGADSSMVARLKLKVASITLVRLGNEAPVLERLGDTSHLRMPAVPSAEPSRTAVEVKT